MSKATTAFPELAQPLLAEHDRPAAERGYLMNRQDGAEFIEQIYNQPLVDLGYIGNPELLGIYSP